MAPNKKKIWLHDLSPEAINQHSENTAVTATGIRITELGHDFLSGTMPVNQNTVQPARILHGGMSCVLAETLGSIASHLCLDHNKEMAVGQSLFASHIRPAQEGDIVTGTAKILHKGKKSHIWVIKIINQKNQLVCDSKLTMAIIPKKH